VTALILETYTPENAAAVATRYFELYSFVKTFASRYAYLGKLTSIKRLAVQKIQYDIKAATRYFFVGKTTKNFTLVRKDDDKAGATYTLYYLSLLELWTSRVSSDDWLHSCQICHLVIVEHGGS